MAGVQFGPGYLEVTSPCREGLGLVRLDFLTL